MTTMVVLQMRHVPDEWRERLRELTNHEGSPQWRWSYHDGSTWCCILFVGDGVRVYGIQGWSVLTLQEEPHPVLGVYVDPDHRGKGYAEQLVNHLLVCCKRHMTTGTVYAYSGAYPKYKQIIEARGYSHLEWE